MGVIIVFHLQHIPILYLSIILYGVALHFRTGDPLNFMVLKYVVSGGHSLHIPKIIVRMNVMFNLAITIRDFSLNSTIEENARLIEKLLLKNMENYCEK